MPSPIATSTNRTTIIGRSSRSSLSSPAAQSATGIGRAGHASQHTYSKPFPVPNYLRHSSYYPRFFTTPPEPSLFGAGVADAEAAAAGSLGLSDALGFNAEGPASPGGGGSILLPTCWDEGDKCNLIELSTDGLGVNFAGSAKYGDRDAAAVRTNRSVPVQAGVYYYEVTITDKGLSGYIGIGFSHREVSLSRLPGWEDNSWGYHGDDGRAFCCLGTGESFGPTFTTGDVVGCGVDYTGAGPEKEGKERSRETAAKKGEGEGGRVFFTKNGDMLGYAFSNVHGKLYPSVGLRTPGEVVRANFGSEPFKFDIEGLVRDRHRTVLGQISSSNIPSTLLLPSPAPAIPSLLPPSKSPTHASERTHETLQALINSYLLHHGYASTAAAFTTQIVAERRERAKGLFGVDPPSPKTKGKQLEEDEEQVTALLTVGSDSSLRAQIRSAFLKGEIEAVGELMRRHYPKVLEGQDERGGIAFKLRLREFVEGVLRVSRRVEGGAEEGRKDVKGKGKASAPLPTSAEDIEMADSTETFSTPPTSPTQTAHSSTTSLDALLALGRSLHADYSADPRPAVQKALELTFSLMAYDSEEALAAAPEEVRALVGEKEREKLADEVNGAILVSQSLPPIPHLESLYRHTSASIRLLGDMGVGAAAMVDVREELLGKR
ncbi:concanavalin A-like lectin/glucanase domain-containing protein [Leucosporidium creatinivorum]|uniref:Concanavalin A-like lectin/glucanase domain-containing protein n=1 Tax=Leucosporidium creatinivorum TaxID=106004 RepID=A0A1Y2E8R7_9BASI|nr:concanavalin A-like lectin/glucanase domain-containing protein [Leucosporidium creatinivorum]